ncbi:MFS transporter [Kribbella deserti]|uniref:MFS transporter n=1 Tax=Kribbella deserti TaxID=1926257 RepID=A0ABV6QI71_9ACTN
MVGRGPLGRDFELLWIAYSTSAIGTALAAGALPLIAITVLDASTLQVSLLATLSGLAAAVIALPFGGLIEHRRKRPVMIGTDLVRFAAAASIPVAALLDGLTYLQLCLVALVTTSATIAYTAASGTHLKALVPADGLTLANSRIESAFWFSNTLGTPIGGGLISLLGATITMALDAVSYLLSAFGVSRIRAPEPAPPVRTVKASKDLVTGWREIFAHRGLNALFWNSQLFGGSVMLVSPLLAVLMLRDLRFAPWQYGLVLGAPCLGGILGARCTPWLTRRYGDHRVLLASGIARAVWLLPLPFAGPGTSGMVLLIGTQFGLLLSAGVFNPSFATYRQRAVKDGYLSRVTASWSISSRTTHPLAIAVGGLLATAFSLPTAILLAALACLLSAALLPWRTVPRPEE